MNTIGAASEYVSRARAARSMAGFPNSGIMTKEKISIATKHIDGPTARCGWITEKRVGDWVIERTSDPTVQAPLHTQRIEDEISGADPLIEHATGPFAVR